MKDGIGDIKKSLETFQFEMKGSTNMRRAGFRSQRPSQGVRTNWKNIFGKKPHGSTNMRRAGFRSQRHSQGVRTNWKKIFGERPRGNDHKIYIIKGYAFLKKNLQRHSISPIAKGLWEGNDADKVEEIEQASTRRLCADGLLKRVLKEDERGLTRFFHLLTTKDPDIAKKLVENKVTDTDRTNFEQVSASVQMVSHTTQTGLKFNDQDEKFFECELQDIPEKVDEIADFLLSQFYISIPDHSTIVNDKDRVRKLRALLVVIQSCHFDSSSNLQNVLGSELYDKWQNSNDVISRQVLDTQVMWDRLEMILSNIFSPLGMRFTQAWKGSLILKFITLANFDVNVLKPEYVKAKVLENVKTVYPEYQDIFKEPVHLAIFLKPSSNTDSAEVYFYLETSGEKEDCSCLMKLGNHERHFIVEEMSPTHLKNWMLNNLHLTGERKKKLRDLTSKDMSRRKMMKHLLSILESLGNEHELLAKYCKEYDRFVYNEVFKKHRRMTGVDNAQGNKMSYKKEEGLQRLSCFWIDFTEESKDMLTKVNVPMIDARKQLLSSFKNPPLSSEGITSISSDCKMGNDPLKSSGVYEECDKYQKNKERRIILMGKTGTGKSTLGNAILGMQTFKNECVQMQSNTEYCQIGYRRTEYGKDIVVLDTPGLMDTKREKAKILEELCKCTAMTAPGPHVFCLVIRCDERFTEENVETLNEFSAFFGEEIYNYVIVVFTHKASMAKNASIEDCFRSLQVEFQDKLSNFGGRKIAIECKAEKRVIKQQIKELLALIEEIIKGNNGGYYSEEKFKAAEEAFRKRIPNLQQLVEEKFEPMKQLVEDEYLMKSIRIKEGKNALKRELQEQIDKMEQEKQLKEKQKAKFQEVLKCLEDKIEKKRKEKEKAKQDLYQKRSDIEKNEGRYLRDTIIQDRNKARAEVPQNEGWGDLARNAVKEQAGLAYDVVTKGIGGVIGQIRSWFGH